MKSFLQWLKRSIYDPTDIELRYQTIDDAIKRIESLVRVMEERTRTIEYVSHQLIFANKYQIDFLQRMYTEILPRLPDFGNENCFNAAAVIGLETDHPIAYESNDHLNPDSTTEGIARPTLFVQDCIRVIGRDMTCLDLGTGSAGLVYEFAMNGVLSVGVDGSDFCRVNRVGYWPLLENNLFTCDITKPFKFVSKKDHKQKNFQIITMWEVLEHLAEQDLPLLLRNIASHLDDKGYFIGSVSLLEYRDDAGNPYHVTLKSRGWWESKFKENGLVILERHPFSEHFFCRGNGPRYQDYHNYHRQPNEGFLFVSKKIN